MKKLLIIALLIVGCDEYAPTEHTHIDTGATVTDTLFVYDTLIVNNYDTTFVYDTLIVTNNEIKEVAWVLTQKCEADCEIGDTTNPNTSSLYYTEGYEPTIIDTLGCCNGNFEHHLQYYFQGDTIYNAISVRNILHYVEPNYFYYIHLNIAGFYNSYFIFPEQYQDYEIFKYEYK